MSNMPPLNFTLNTTSMPIAAGQWITFNFSYDASLDYTIFYGPNTVNTITNPQWQPCSGTFGCTMPDTTTSFILQAVGNSDETTRQECITITIAPGTQNNCMILISTITDITTTAQQPWQTIPLPTGYSRFELVLDGLIPATAASMAVAQLQFNGEYVNSNYSGTGWGNDGGGNGFFEYTGQSVINLSPLGRGGSNPTIGVSGIVRLILTAGTTGFDCIQSQIYAPSAYGSEPMAGATSSHWASQNGAVATAIQIGYGMWAGDSTPTSMDTVNGGNVRLYGIV